jgi:DNA topoisomerase-1
MKQSKSLVIVESPAKAHKIQEYLGKDYIVMASKGHIADLGKGGKHGLGVDIENNFKPRYVLMEDHLRILDDLINAAKQCDLIYLAGDPDREGTAICWHLKQRLEDVGKPFKRALFNQIKKDKIIKAIQEAGDIDMNVVHSQECRRILDRIVGFMASPFLMNFFGPNLSAGRVQSVVTRLVVDREREIENFVPETFWTIQVSLSKDGENGFLTKYSGKLIDLQSAQNMRARLAIKDAKYIVSDVLADEERKGPFAPLVTSSLQQIMSRSYSMGADRTMKAAQSLYENGYCTYIRTDSVRVDEEAVQEARRWLASNKHAIPTKPNIYRNKDTSQDAHECIRPTDITLLPDSNMAIIEPDEQVVYKIIWKYFIASQMMPAVYNTLKVTAHVENDLEAEVKASGRAIKSKGYLEILGVKDEGKIDIPSLAVGDILSLFGPKPVKMEKKQTQPPPRYSEDKLIKELVNKNIGRPSTFADLLSKITSRNYVDKQGNVYHATELGKKITDILKQFFTFLDYDYTAVLERKLDEIESGKVDYIETLKQFYPEFKKELDKSYISYGGTLCDKCGNPMATRTAKANGEKFLACQNYPKCRNTKPLANNSQVTESTG